LDTSVIHPATPLGSPPVRRPGADELGEAALTALRRHPDALALLAAGPAPDWFALGSDAREALRDVADSVAVLLRRPGDDTLARYAEQQRTEAARLRTEVTRLTAVIEAARPHTTPAELAPLLYEAYIGRVRAAMPPGVAFAGWDQLDDGDPMAFIARDAFTAVAQVALEPVKADYDQAAELHQARADRDAAIQRVGELAIARDGACDALGKILAGLESGGPEPPLDDDGIIALARTARGRYASA
jgi:hypothetical protein